MKTTKPPSMSALMALSLISIIPVDAAFANEPVEVNETLSTNLSVRANIGKGLQAVAKDKPSTSAPFASQAERRDQPATGKELEPSPAPSVSGRQPANTNPSPEADRLPDTQGAMNPDEEAGPEHIQQPASSEVGPLNTDPLLTGLYDWTNNGLVNLPWSLQARPGRRKAPNDSTSKRFRVYSGRALLSYGVPPDAPGEVHVEPARFKGPTTDWLWDTPDYAVEPKGLRILWVGW